MSKNTLSSLIAIIVSAVVASVSLTSCNNSSDEITPPPDNSNVAVIPDDAVNALYYMEPVDNMLESVKRCNRRPGSGVLMSFDDFGTTDQVQAILNKLGEHKMRAAFFPTGEWAIENYDLILRMRSEGHILGNHTHTHANLEELSANDESAFYGEIYPVEGMINTDPQLLRPPYGAGHDNPRVIERLNEKGIQVCTWTADTRDWKIKDADEMMNLVKNGDEYILPLAPDGVILAHMFGEHSVTLIDAIVHYLNQKGWAYERPNPHSIEWGLFISTAGQVSTGVKH